MLRTVGHGIGYIGGFAGGVNPLVGILVALGIFVFIGIVLYIGKKIIEG